MYMNSIGNDTWDDVL